MGGADDQGDDRTIGSAGPPMMPRSQSKAGGELTVQKEQIPTSLSGSLIVEVVEPVRPAVEHTSYDQRLVCELQRGRRKQMMERRRHTGGIWAGWVGTPSIPP